MSDVARTAPLQIAVVGAGPVGLALALQAARALPDASVTLFDARPAEKDVSGDPRTQLKDQILDALFTRAVQDAFSPTLQEWVDGHHAEIMDSLKPVIRDWMDDNLPNLIEAAVKRPAAHADTGRTHVAVGVTALAVRAIAQIGPVCGRGRRGSSDRGAAAA